MDKAFVDTSVILRLLIKDEPRKIDACRQLIQKASVQGNTLHLPPVTILETVWVLEKLYRLSKKEIRELVEAILNTPAFRCEMEDIFRNALRTYDEKNIKFADAVMGCWGLDHGLTTVYTYDEKHFRRIPGLTVRTP